MFSESTQSRYLHFQCGPCHCKIPTWSWHAVSEVGIRRKNCFFIISNQRTNYSNIIVSFHCPAQSRRNAPLLRRRGAGGGRGACEYSRLASGASESTKEASAIAAEKFHTDDNLPRIQASLPNNYSPLYSCITTIIFFV